MNMRQKLDRLADRLMPDMTLAEIALFRTDLRRLAIDAGSMERALDEMVAEAMEDARLPVHVPPLPSPVIRLADFRS